MRRRTYSAILAISVIAVMPLHATDAKSIPKGQLKRVTFPIYDPGHPQAVAVIRADQVSTEHQRKGFFRIGLLPVRVAEGVTIEIRDKDRVTAALQGLDGWRRAAGGGRAVELRRVTFLNTEGQPALKAATVKMDNEGSWRLIDVEVVSGPASLKKLPEAQLQMSGPRAGALTFGDESLPNLFDVVFADRKQTGKAVNGG